MEREKGVHGLPLPSAAGDSAQIGALEHIEGGTSPSVPSVVVESGEGAVTPEHGEVRVQKVAMVSGTPEKWCAAMDQSTA